MALGGRRAAGPTLYRSPLLPGAVLRWWTRRRLPRGEAYLFELLAAVRHNSITGDAIARVTRRPTVVNFRRLVAHLAGQCNDSPRVMSEIVGEELTLILRAQAAIYRIDQTFTGVAVADLRHVAGGARFRIHRGDEKVYRVMESNPTHVLYHLDGVTDVLVRAYPKEEGPINVYLEP